MSSHLLKCVKYQVLFLESVIFNQRNRIRSLITLCQSGLVPAETSNDMSPLRKEVANKKLHKSRAWKLIDQLPETVRRIEIERLLKKIIYEGIHASDALTLLQNFHKILDYVPSKKIEFIEHLWNYLLVTNVPLSLDHYNGRLTVYLKYDYDFSPMAILEEMERNAVYPNVETYNLCIQYYCNKGKIKCTNPILNIMNKRSILVTENILNSLIWGYYNSGDCETALELFNTRLRSSTRKNKVYTIYMCIHASENKFYKIKEILQTCDLHKIKFSNEDILTVIYRLSVNNYTKHINEIVPYLKKISLSDDEINILLKLIYVNQIDVAKTLLLYFDKQRISKSFLQHLVDHTKDTYTIINMCDFLETNKLCTDSLEWAVYYSYFNNLDQSLSLLKVYKRNNMIKPHFFWPLLVQKANAFDVKGLLNIITIMNNDFNISPCLITLCKYILPYLYGSSLEVRNRLIKSGTDEVLIDNACLLLNLKKLKTQNALQYVKTFPGPYFYKYIAPELKNAFINSRDTEILLDVFNRCLLESKYNHVPFDKLLQDIIDDGYIHESRLIKIRRCLEERKIDITFKTLEKVEKYLAKND